MEINCYHTHLQGYTNIKPMQILQDRPQWKINVKEKAFEESNELPVLLALQRDREDLISKHPGLK